MQELTNISPNNYIFAGMSSTPADSTQMLNSQIAITSYFMMQMGNHLSSAAHEMRKSLEEN